MSIHFSIGGFSHFGHPPSALMLLPVNSHVRPLLFGPQNPFEVGDEVHFFYSNRNVEGHITDIGWYRTLIRSYEREVRGGLDHRGVGTGTFEASENGMEWNRMAG